MILSGSEIRKNLGKGIEITPFNENQLGPNSYNLRLADELLVYKDFPLDMKKKNEVEHIKIPETGFLMEPYKLYLGRTVEHTKTDNFIPMLEGRSSIGRLGIFIHVTAGFGDVGFSGYWTLELFCIHPVIIYPNVEICQIYYHSMLGEGKKYNSKKYQDNKGVQPSLLYLDFEDSKKNS